MENKTYSSQGIYVKEKHRRIYKLWSHIKDRCYCKTNKDYKNYGARGIIVCDEWKNNFVEFFKWAIANNYDDTLTIDRIDFNGNYEPSNCRWVTPKEQARNRRNNKLITYNNETHCISEWAEITGIPRKCLEYRIRKWESLERVFNRQVTRNRHL